MAPRFELTATARQEEACRSYADARGWDVVAVYEDTELSAYRPRVTRPAYDELVAELSDDRIDAVLVWRLDRLVRRPQDFERFWALCEQHRVRLASVNESFDTSTPIGVAMCRLLVSFANLESRAMSERIHAQARQAAYAGKPPHSKLFGYAQDRSRVVETEAALIREAAARVAAGETTTAVAQDWNRRGLPSPRGTKWYGEILRKLLTSPGLVGDRTWHGEVVVRDCWPPILDRDAWERLRPLLAKHPHEPRDHTERYATGILLCGECERTLRPYNRNGRVGYGCIQEGDHCVAIAADPLEEWLTHVALHRLFDTMGTERDAAERWPSPRPRRPFDGSSENLAALVLAQSPRDAWAEYSAAQRRDVLGALIDSVVVLRGWPGRFRSQRLRIRWRGSAEAVVVQPCYDTLACRFARYVAAVGNRLFDKDASVVTVRQAAGLLGLQRAAIQDMIHEGHLASSISGHVHLIRRSDVWEYAEAHRLGRWPKPNEAGAAQAPGEWFSVARACKALHMDSRTLLSLVDHGVATGYQFRERVRFKVGEVERLRNLPRSRGRLPPPVATRLRSVTELVRDPASPVRQFFDRDLGDIEVVRRRWSQSATPRLKPTAAYEARSAIGLTFEYRFKYFFGHLPLHELPSAIGAQMVRQEPRSSTGEWLLESSAATVYDALADELAAFVAHHDPRGRVLARADEERLCRYCSLLAAFEIVFRSRRDWLPQILRGLTRAPTVEELLALPQQSDIDDVVALVKAVPQTDVLRLCGQPFIPGPVFGRSGVAADGDLLVGSTLIEVKTIAHPGVRREWIYQLLSYLFLDAGRHNISSVGLYASRAPAFLTWPADELLQMLSRTPLSRTELQERFNASIQASRRLPQELA